MPPEIRGHIAFYCTLRSLGRLCLVDRLWAAEAEPYLCQSVQLCFSDDNKGVLLSSIDALSRSPRKLAHIRALLIELVTDSDPPPLHILRSSLSRLLLGADSLEDLRFRGQSFDFQRMVLAAMAQAGVAFRLRTLYIVGESVGTPDLSAVMEVHAATLRLVAIHPWTEHQQRLQQLAARLRIHTVEFNPDLVLFAYIRTPLTFVVAVDTPTPTSIAAVEQSLSADPSPRIARAFVNGLHIDCSVTPPDDLLRAYVSSFPRVTRLWATISYGRQDAAALAAVLSRFPLLAKLQLSEPGQDMPEPDRPWRVRLALADGLTAHGCAMLREIKFVDWTTAQRDVRLDDTPVGPWYDADKPEDPWAKNISLYE